MKKIKEHKISLDHLNEYILIQECHLEKDSEGGYTSNLRDVNAVWAHVEPLIPSQNNELWLVGEHSFVSRYRLGMRGNILIKSNYRFLWNCESFRPLSAPVYVNNKRFITFIVQKTIQENL